MTIPRIRFEGLAFAFEFADGFDIDSCAFIYRKTGKFFFEGDGIEDPVSDDLRQYKQYIQIADRHDLDLGRRLAMNSSANFKFMSATLKSCNQGQAAANNRGFGVALTTGDPIFLHRHKPIAKKEKHVINPIR